MPNESPLDKSPWDQLARLFADELPQAEAEQLRAWIAGDPERSAMVNHLREVWSRAGDLRQAWDAEGALAQIKQVPAGPVRVVPIPKFYREEPLSPGRRLVRLGLRAAAAVALVAGGAGVWRLAIQGPAPEAPVTVAEMATPRGQRATLRLPDGTRVMLGPASTLRYASTYTMGARAVQLDGEAYFEVVHDSIRPFTVRTARGVATDLGTTFGVRAYASDSVLRVVVTEGRVSLAPARDTTARPRSQDSLLLSPGDLGRIGPNGSLTARRGIDLSGYLAWTEGRLVFQDTPVGEVVVQLGRWFDLDVRLADTTIGSKRLTASFANEPAPEVLQLVAASLGLRVEQRGQAVTLRAKP
jgi:transmembrane sensor